MGFLSNPTISCGDITGLEIQSCFAVPDMMSPLVTHIRTACDLFIHYMATENCSFPVMLV